MLCALDGIMKSRIKWKTLITEYYCISHSTLCQQQTEGHHPQLHLNIPPLYTQNFIISKADKGRTTVIIDKEIYKQKVTNFLHENQYIQLHKDPIETFHKQTLMAIQDSTLLIDKQKRKYVTQIKPQAPILNA
jgi:hypothetical protein